MEEGRQRVFSGAPHEERYGYCRAVRVGQRITVAGTAPVWPDGSCEPDAGAQARRCCEIIATALAELGGGLDDVVRTRMFVTSAEDSEAVGDVHAEFFGSARPAATMVVVTALLDPRWKVEIEVDAVASRPASVEVMDPDDLSKNESYSQVAIGSGSRLIFVAGQVSETAEGEFVGEGDFAFQARQAFANVGRALVAAGVGVEAVARITIYVVDHRPEYLPLISAARVAVFGDHKPTDVILGVQRLAEPGRMIEVDAVAVTYLEERL